ncbi:MAG: ester cyclase [Pseudomonadota bacterium]
MKAGDNRWVDFPGYIVGITKEIWEDRGLGPKMKEYYHPDCIVRMPGGISVGEPASTEATIATLHVFPDRQLLAEDVIWSGDIDAGMLSSHRIYNTATHLGEGAYGKPTGRLLHYRGIADCYAKDGQISDEWLIRDNGAIIRQIGTTPEAWARGLLAEGRAGVPLTPETDMAGPYGGRGNHAPEGERLAGLLTRIMEKDFAAIGAEYDRAAELYYPGGLDARGPAAADRFWLGLRSAFPDAKFAVHHVIGRSDPDFSPRAAIRWSLTGEHGGPGPFGPASGATVHVMGITHAEFGPWGLRREWTLYDEVAIWTQILAAGD